LVELEVLKYLKSFPYWAYGIHATSANAREN